MRGIGFQPVMLRQAGSLSHFRSESAPVIQFNCPNCNRLLETPDGTSGAKFACPICGQRMEVPTPRPGGKTLLGTLPDDDPATPLSTAPLIPYSPREEPVYDEPRRERVRRGRDDYDDDFEERGRGRRRSRRSRIERRDGFECPFCGSDEFPRVKNEVSTAGWVVFIILILFCTPLCWIGILITEEKRLCRDCGMKLG